MSSALNAIIASSFRLPNSAAANVINARDNRRVTDSNLNTAALNRETQQFNLGQAQNEVAKQDQVANALMELQRIESEAPGLQAAYEQGVTDRVTAAQGPDGEPLGKIRPELRDRAISMLMNADPSQELTDRQDKALRAIIANHTGAQDALIGNMLAPEPEPNTEIAKLHQYRETLPEGSALRDEVDARIAKLNYMKPADSVTTNNNIDMGKAESAGVKKAAETAAVKLSEAETESSKAYNMLAVIDGAQDALDRGIISGTAAEFRTDFARFLETVGIGDGSAANTDAYLAGTAGLVADVIKQFGSGSGLSDADREFAKIMSGASNTITVPALRRILHMNAIAQTNKLKAYNDDIARIGSKFPELASLYKPVNIPEIEPLPNVLEGIEGLNDLSASEQARLESYILNDPNYQP